MSEPLYVDPERLARQGRPYEDASRNWYELQDRIAGIRARYAGVWGDDDMGNQFGPSFDQGMDSVELRAKGVGDTLGYYGEGLVENGKIFADAREGAEDSSHAFLQETNYIGGHDAPHTTNPYLYGVSASYSVEGNRYDPGENTELEATEPLVAARRVEGRLLARGVLAEGESTEGEVTPLQPTYMMARTRVALRAEEGEAPLEPLQGRRLPAIPAEEVPLQPLEGRRLPAIPAEEGELPLQPVYRATLPGEEVLPLQPAHLTQPVVVRSEKPESE